MTSLLRLSETIEKYLSLTGIHFYFIRHGQSLANHSGSVVGWSDSKLSVKGREQANKLYRAFYPHVQSFSHIHTSDLSRCIDTLNIALGFPSRPFILSKQLRQLNFGDDQGIHFDSLPQQQKDRYNTFDYQAPNGENWGQARKRAMSYLKTLQEGHHLICCHGGLMCALMYDLGLKRVVPNCSVVGVQLCQKQKQLIKLNFVWQFENEV